MTSGLQTTQPKNDVVQKMKMPETTALIIHDASVRKTKYKTSKTLANIAMRPYGIILESTYFVKSSIDPLVSQLSE